MKLGNSANENCCGCLMNIKIEVLSGTVFTLLKKRMRDPVTPNYI
jgi:hypothetical protein